MPSSRTSGPRPAVPTASPPRPSPHPLAVIAVCVFGAFVLALVYAEPIQDGDLFWHLAYAKQMVSHHTLIPDASIYSWTPTGTSTIYCAWLAELVLYGIWRVTGLAGLFVLRYLVIGAVAAMLWRYAWRLGLGRRVVTAVVILLVALASYAGTLVKPELLSLLLFSIIVFLYFRARLAARDGGDCRPWLMAVPAVLLVWVNTHGAFIFAAPFLIATAAGELLNFRFSPGIALPRHTLKWLLGSWAACAVVVNITPYGPAYPVQLIGDYVFGHTPRPDEAWNVAHLPIFDHRALGLHFVEFGIVAAALLIPAFVVAVARRHAAVDWSLVLVNLVFVPLYVVTLRTTYFWPTIFGYSMFTLLAATGVRTTGAAQSGMPPRRALLTAVLALLFVALGGQAAYGAYVAPHSGSWLGFGTGYVNPVVEAKYVQREKLGPRLYNVFDSGGYLLWKLSPRDKVMVDSRSFPYLSWFDQQQAFAEGRNVPRFVGRYRADAAVIDLQKSGTWRAFLDLPDWRPVFYGPTAAVFVRDPKANLLDSRDRLWSWQTDLRNAGTALNAFEFASYVGDFPRAWRILDQVRGPLGHQHIDATRRQAALDYRRGYAALNAHDYERASTLLLAGLRDRDVSPHDDLVLRALADVQRARVTGQTDDVARLQSQLEQLAGPART